VRMGAGNWWDGGGFGGEWGEGEVFEGGGRAAGRLWRGGCQLEVFLWEKGS